MTDILQYGIVKEKSLKFTSNNNNFAYGGE